MRTRAFVVNGKSSCCGAGIGFIYNKDSDGNDTQRDICNKCGTTIIRCQFNKKNPPTFREWSGVVVGSLYGPRVRLVSLFSVYSKTRKGENQRVIRTDKKEILTYNYQTGKMYFIIMKNGKKQMIRTADYNMVAMGSGHEMTFFTQCVKHRAVYLFPEVDILAIFKSITGTDDIGGIIRHFSKKHDFDLMFRILQQPNYAKIYFLKHNFGYLPKKLDKQLDSINSPMEVLDLLFNNPTKKVKKYIMDKRREFSSIIPSMYAICRLFDKDRLLTLFEQAGVFDGVCKPDMQDRSGKRIFSREMGKFLRQSKKFISSYGEKRLLNHLLAGALKFNNKDYYNNVFMWLEDSIRLYEEILKKDPEFKLSRQAGVNAENGGLRAVHDAMSKYNNKLREPNIEIEYRNKELEINKHICVIKDKLEIEFKLANDTWELIDVGQSMGICVGSYGKMAVNKNINIVVGYVSGAPKVCMELRESQEPDSEFDIVQAKLQFNEHLNTNVPLFEATMAWMESVGIGVLNPACYEMKPPKGSDYITWEEMDADLAALDEEPGAAQRVYNI